MFITADLPPMAAEIRQAEQQGKLYGVFTCHSLSQGAITAKEMAQRLLYAPHEIQSAFAAYQYWAGNGQSELSKSFVTGLVDYSLTNCPYLFRIYLQTIEG